MISREEVEEYFVKLEKESKEKFNGEDVYPYMYGRLKGMIFNHLEERENIENAIRRKIYE